jgi:hypothetical protein
VQVRTGGRRRLRRCGEEWRVGLDEHPVERRARGRVADVVGVVERDDAAERQVRAEIERPFGLVGAAREAVEDGARRHARVG